MICKWCNNGAHEAHAALSGCQCPRIDCKKQSAYFAKSKAVKAT